MRITMLLATLMLTGLLTASAQDASSQAATGASSGTSTLTGCLKGKQDQYYIVEQNGKRHTLQPKNQDLSTYVNHEVTVTGRTSPSRDAGTTSDAEGHRKGYFSVDSVSDQGACKK
jgi:hypothetical protein